MVISWLCQLEIIKIPQEYLETDGLLSFHHWYRLLPHQFPQNGSNFYDDDENFPFNFVYKMS